jgi:hypothetical protein
MNQTILQDLKEVLKKHHWAITLKPYTTADPDGLQRIILYELDPKPIYEGESLNSRFEYYYKTEEDAALAALEMLLFGLDKPRQMKEQY